MNCKACSKIIPDGFTDCPWCGAAFGAAQSFRDPSAADDSSSHNLITVGSAFSSALLFLVLTYFSAQRNVGPLSLDNWAYFFGSAAAALLLGAVLVFVFCKIRHQTLRRPIHALLVLTLASLFALLSLALPAKPRIQGIDPVTVRRYEDPTAPKPSNPHPASHSKWDSANRSLMQDIAARNQQYVSEISALDETAKPLYTPESFRDSVTVQEIINQLNARIMVADKFSDWRPVFSRMNDYIASVDATDDEKRKFLQAYQSAMPKTLAVCKEISNKEHAWLQASLDLYQFALAKQGQYTWQKNNLAFAKRSDSILFRQKFFKARSLNAQFLQEYWQVRQAQEAMMAQLGMAEPATGTAQTQ